MTTPQSNNEPLVSVILCTYNRERLVRRAIKSVLRQSYTNWELIIIDDGSTDDTDRMVLPVVKRDRRLRFVRHANKGLALSRNDGIALAQGAFIAFLDSDDEYAEKHLECRIHFMRRRRDVGLVYGGIRCVGPNKRQFVPDVERPGTMIHVSKCFTSGTIVARRSVLLRAGGFRNVVFAEDYDLVQRIKTFTRIARSRSATYIYHVDADDRLCDLYAKGGEEGILNFRGTAR